MYLSVTDLLNQVKKPFDKKVKATKKARQELKDQGIRASKEVLQEQVNLVLAEWERLRKQGISYQKYLCDKDLSELSECSYEGYTDDPFEGGLLDIELCKLSNRHTYLEKLLFSNKYKLLGYADKIYIDRNTINIIDNKVVKKIYRSSSFKASTGFKVQGERFLPPLSHLDDCNYNLYALQLSLYMYLAWEANKYLKIGKLFIRHIKLNESGVVLEDEMIEVPYMKDEVKLLLKIRKISIENENLLN